MQPYIVFRKRFKDWVTLCTICLQWSFHFKFELMITPRYFTFYFQATGEEPIVQSNETGEYLLVIFKASHLLGLRVNCHSLGQIQIWCSSQKKFNRKPQSVFSMIILHLENCWVLPMFTSNSGCGYYAGIILGIIGQ